MFRIKLLRITICCLIFCLTSKAFPAEGKTQLQTARTFLRSLQPGQDEIIPMEEIQPLLEKLGHEKWQTRDEATRNLISRGAPTKPHLLPLTHSPDPEVALRARRILDALAPPPLPPSYEELWKAIRILALSDSPKEAPEMLIPLLGHEDEELRTHAADILQRLTRRPLQIHDNRIEISTSATDWENWWKENRDSFRYDPGQESAFLFCSPEARKLVAVSLDGDLLWQRVFHKSPRAVDLLPNGNLLVSFTGEKADIKEISPQGKVIWKGEFKDPLEMIFDVQILGNGNLLLTDDPGGRVVEVDRDGTTVWDSGPLANPHAAYRTKEGLTVIAVHKGDAVIAMDPEHKEIWRLEEQPAVTDIRPLPGGNAITVTRMGSQDKVVVADQQGGEVSIYKTGWPVTSGFLTAEGIRVSANEHNGLLLGKTSLRPLGIPRPGIWGKIRIFPRILIEKAAPDYNMNPE